MRWSDERYVRVYTRDTPDLLALGWEARALLWELLRKADRAGILDLGKSGVRGLSGLTQIPLDVVTRALPVLLEDGCVVMSGNQLLVSNYIEAQTAKQSDKQRQAESRARAREAAKGEGEKKSRESTESEQPVTERDSCLESVTNRDKKSEPVTSGEPSVTLCCTDPSSEFLSPRAHARSNEDAKLRLTGHHLLTRFGAIRGEVFPGAMSWDTPRDPKGDASSLAESIADNEQAKADVEPTMRLALEHIRDSSEGWEKPLLSKDPSYAFGAWKSGFHALREELHGRSPKVAKKEQSDRRPGQPKPVHYPSLTPRK